MSAKEDVFVEHELRLKLQDVLAEFHKDIRHVMKACGAGSLWPASWQEIDSVKLLCSEYADDIIKEIQDCRASRGRTQQVIRSEML